MRFIDGEERQEVLRQVSFEDPCPPRRVDPRVPIELETIVLKAVEKNPADRFATAREMADDLRRFLDDQPIRARRPGLRDQAVKWARRHRAWAQAAAAALVLVTIVSLTAVVLVNAARRNTQAALVAETRAKDDAKQAMAAETKAKHKARQAIYGYVEAVQHDEMLKDETGDNVAALGSYRKAIGIREKRRSRHWKRRGGAPLVRPGRRRA